MPDTHARPSLLSGALTPVVRPPLLLLQLPLQPGV